MAQQVRHRTQEHCMKKQTGHCRILKQERYNWEQRGHRKTPTQGHCKREPPGHRSFQMRERYKQGQLVRCMWEQREQHKIQMRERYR
jgi:hypothetical protein